MIEEKSSNGGGRQEEDLKYADILNSFSCKNQNFSRWHCDVVQKNNRPTFFIAITRIKVNKLLLKTL